MKTSSTSSRPGLTCRFLRAWSALAGDPAADQPRGLIARHAATCPCCREHYAAARDLESRLRRAAPRQAHPLPPGFEQRMDRVIADTIRDARTARAARSSASSSGSRLVLWGGVAAAAAAVAVAFLLRPAPQDSPRQEQQYVEIEANPAEILNESVAVARNLNDRFWNDVAPTATTIVRENPLQQELGAVYSEAQSALQFLAMNFLPGTTPGTAPATETGAAPSRSG